jgi:hypothetical protein
LFALMCIKFKSHPNSPHYQANNRQGDAWLAIQKPDF